MEDLNSIKAKISALLAKAEGTNNAFEAEAFMAKVNELLERYQIERHELGGEKDELGFTMGSFNVYASMSWAKPLINELCRYYGAQMIMHAARKNHYPYEVAGRESSRVTAELMIPYVVSQVRQQAKVYHVANPRLTRSTAEANIGKALASRVLVLANEMGRRREDAMASASAQGHGTALVTSSELKGLLATRDDLEDVKPRSFEFRTSAREYADKISLTHQAAQANRKMLR